MPALKRRRWTLKNVMLLMTLVAIDLAIVRWFNAVRPSYTSLRNPVAEVVFFMAPCWNVMAVVAYRVLSKSGTKVKRAGRLGFLAGMSLVNVPQFLWGLRDPDSLWSLGEWVKVPLDSIWRFAISLGNWAAVVVGFVLSLLLIFVCFLALPLMVGIIISRIARQFALAWADSNADSSI